MIIILMGVTGSGKTTIGSLLAGDLRWQFYDADDFYSKEEQAKRKRGLPLTDQEHAAWLLSVRNRLLQSALTNRSVVLACSALTEKDRRALKIENAVIHWVYLKTTFEAAQKRVVEQKSRGIHLNTLAAEFEALQEPKKALTVKNDRTPGEIVDEIREKIEL